MPDDLAAKTTLLLLEVTSHCNMHCTFCPSDDLVRRKGHVSDEQAVQLIRAAHDLAPGIPIMFNVLGEPFLNKKLFDYIALCEECGVKVALITNITLLTEERLKKLYRFRNVHLNLSLHTPTDKAFAERGYQKVSSFREYTEMLSNAVEARFRYNSTTTLDIYLACELTENLIQNDNGSRLWTLFEDPKEYEAGWNLVARRFTELGAKIECQYPEAFAQSMVEARREFAPEIAAREIVFRAEELPEWKHETQRSGWMCAPGVIIRRKGFGMWAYHEKFMQRHAQPGRFVFHEERSEPFTCIGARSFGILSDGAYTLCCQDVEGEMDIGNIATLDVREAFHSRRRAEIIENCATSRICRRCAGNTMILDTRPVSEGVQAIDKFGFGWHMHEPHLFARGGRWTGGSAKSYFYTRMEVASLAIEFRSPFPSDIAFQALVSAYDPATRSFALEESAEFYGRRDRMVREEIPLKLRANTFYRLTLLSPTFVPKELYGSQDERRLGMAVVSLGLSGQPFEALSSRLARQPAPDAAMAGQSSRAYQFPILG